MREAEVIYTYEVTNEINLLLVAAISRHQCDHG